MKNLMLLSMIAMILLVSTIIIALDFPDVTLVDDFNGTIELWDAFNSTTTNDSNAFTVTLGGAETYLSKAEDPQCPFESCMSVTSDSFTPRSYGVVPEVNTKVNWSFSINIQVDDNNQARTLLGQDQQSDSDADWGLRLNTEGASTNLNLVLKNDAGATIVTATWDDADSADWVAGDYYANIVGNVNFTNDVYSVQLIVNGTLRDEASASHTFVVFGDELVVGADGDSFTTIAKYSDFCFFTNSSVPTEVANQGIFNNGNGINHCAVITADVADTTPPTSASPSINNSNPQINQDVLLSILAQDETELSTVSFAHNQTGILSNVSVITASGVSFNATATLGITLIKNNVIGFQWSINDTSGNTAQTTIDTFTIANAPPETATILFPTSNLLTRQQPLDLNVTFPSDADGDSITINYYINGTLNRTSASNVSLEASSNVYQLNVELNDGEDSSANATVIFEIDIDAPAVTLEAPTPANNSFSTSIIQVFNLSITEPHLDTITLDFNGTNETGFANDFGNFFSLTRNTMAEGLFTYQIFANDTLGNEFVSDLLQFTVDNTSPTIIYTLPADNNLTIITDLTGKVDILGFNINLDIGNLTVFNQTNGQIFQNITSGITSSTFTFVDSFGTVFENQPDGNYRFRSCFIDDVNIETCQDVNMTLTALVVAPIITGQAVLPLENASSLVGIVALLIIILGALGFGTFGISKK